MASTRERPTASRPTAATSVVRAPRRASQRAAFAADPPWTSETRPGTSVARSSARAGATTTSSTRSPSTTMRAGPGWRDGTGGRVGEGAGRAASAWAPRIGAHAPVRSARVADRPTMALHLPARAGVPPDDRCRDARPRPPRDRHDPDPLDGRRPAGEFRAPGRPDGRGADGLHAVDPVPAPRPDEPGMAGPRPLRALRRPRQHAALLAAPPDRLRPLARRPQGVPPVGLAHPGTPGARPDARASRRRRGRSVRASRMRSAWPSPSAAWRPSSTATST